MPLLDTGVIAAASGPTIHTATTYDGLARTGVAHGERGEVRSDVADADTVQEAYIAILDATVARPVWVPAWAYTRYSAYLSNGAGKRAAVLPADTNLAAVTDRGFTNDSTSGGTVTKSASNPLVLTGATGSQTAKVSYVDAPAAVQLMVAKVKVTFGSNTDDAFMYMGSSSHYTRLDVAAGGTGTTDFNGGGSGQIDLSTAKWVMWLHAQTAATSAQLVWTVPNDEDGMVLGDRQDVATAYGPGFYPQWVARAVTSGAKHEIAIYEAHILELT